MVDGFGRSITCLRISVTDRCNLRCTYCMPEKGVKLLGHDEILSYEEIVQVALAATKMGVTKLRLTGGEPLVRTGIESLVRMLSNIPGVSEMAMTTNGVLLPEFARKLADAGLRRVNISLDAIDPDRYRGITRGGDVRRALAGIDAAVRAGLKPVKLNCVVEQSSSEHDAQDVARFSRENGLEVRFIRKMDIASGRFFVVEGGRGGDCKACDRLRLSSDGMIRPCLFSDLKFGVREMGSERAIQAAISRKPEKGTACNHNWISGIGG